MLHSIGRRAKSEDLVALLLDCHGRIRTFTGMAIVAGDRMEAPLEDVVDACRRVERYFRQALPLHVQDEEESVLPRLIGRSAELDAALARMREEHELHAEPLGRLLALGAVVRATPDDAGARAALASVGRQLTTAFEPHLEAEERVVFPAIRALVSTEEQAAILGELRARRQDSFLP
jgi:iron-sulfur cluster repair protein YtfE (RIC family)